MKKFLLLFVLVNFSVFAPAQVNISESLIPSGMYSMGDHFGFVDPNHPSDEIPLHNIQVDSFYMAAFETTNQQFLDFLNAALLNASIYVQNNRVYLSGDTTLLYYTNQFQPWYSIGFNGTSFSLVDFRAKHPVVGAMWCGAALYCNWLSAQNGLQACYNLQTWDCDFSKNGYRLPTEAEWEWAARGGHTNPYLNYPNSNTIQLNEANLPASGDPYENGAYPNTTPVGFYDGTLKLKSNYSWPGASTSYQTANGINGFGLYDVQGNVWELVNDWYSQNYYSLSPMNNPHGPASGFLMPDGKPYRGMRGGNWYNGYIDSTGINNGHSRVSNRNPSYYRGPLDPNHPWYHVGFRIARNYSTSTGLDPLLKSQFQLTVYPNPVNQQTSIQYSTKNIEAVEISIYDVYGRLTEKLVNEKQTAGMHQLIWNCQAYPGGVYSLELKVGNELEIKKIIHMN